jgi:competence protein ComEC
MIDWHKLPFVRFFVPFISGILLAIYSQIIPFSFATTILICTILLSILATTVKRYALRWAFGIPLSISLFLIGYLCCFFKIDIYKTTHFKQFYKENVDNLISGTVYNVVEKRAHYRLTLAIDAIKIPNDTAHYTTGNLLIYLKKDTLSTQNERPPQYGDRLVAQCRISAIDSAKNPLAFDFKNYWHLQNIHYQTFIKFDNFNIIEKDKGNIVKTWALKCQKQLVEILQKHLTDEQTYAVGSALLLGYNEAITEDLKDAYIQTGAMHILAISGMHILLIFSLLGRILDIYKSGNRRIRWSKALLLIILIWLFALLTGLGASVVRAAVMASLLAIGKVLNRNGSIYNLLAASAFVILLFDPLMVMNIGFQLSYMAVLGIFIFADKIRSLWPTTNKLFDFIWKNISIGLAAQLMVSPLALYYFHQFPTYFWLSSLLVGILADGALIVGIVLLVVDKIPLISYFLGKILFGLIALMNNIIFIIQKMPYHLIEGIWLSFFTVVIIYIILFSTVRAFRSHYLRDLYYPLSMICILGVIYAFETVENSNRKQLVVYYIPKNSAIDIITEKKCYTFYEKFSENIDNKNRIKFAVDNYRNSLKIKELKAFDFIDNFKNNIFIYQNGFMKIGATTVTLLDKMPIKGLILNSDYVIVRNNPRLDIGLLKQIIAFKMLIFDGSNSKWQVQKWKEACQKEGITYYDIAEKGAWIYNF